MKAVSPSRWAMGLPSLAALFGFFLACGKLLFLVAFRWWNPR
jgi:hypothetical protein